MFPTFVRKIPAIVAAVLLLAAVLVVSSPLASAAPDKGLGIQGITLGGSVGATGWAGTWRVYAPERGTTVDMTCVEWHAAAPDSNPGAYVYTGLSIDPIQGHLQSILQEIKEGRSFWSNTPEVNAALSIASKYRQAQFAAPGGIPPYSPSPGYPSGPGDFLVGYPPNPAVAATVAQLAYDMYTTSFHEGVNWTITRTSTGAHPAAPNGTTSMTYRVLGTNGFGVNQPIAGVRLDGAAQNGTVVSGTFAGTPVAGSVGVTDANGYATFVIQVTDPFQTLGVGVSSTYTPTPARLYSPINPAQQNMAAFGDWGTLLDLVSLDSPTTTVRILKTTSNPSYQSGAGAVFDLRTVPSGVSVGTLTVPASGQSNTLTVLPGNYSAVEVSTPNGQATHPPVAVTAPSTGAVRNVNVVNQVTSNTSLQITKSDAINGEALAGAGFVVRRDGNNDGTYGVADPADSVGGAGFSGSGPYGPGPDTTWGTPDDVASDLTVDGVIPGPGLDGLYGTPDDDGLFYSSDSLTTPVAVGPLPAGKYQVTEVVPPPDYLPPAPGPGPDGIWGTVDDEPDTVENHVRVATLTPSSGDQVDFNNAAVITVATSRSVAGSNIGDPVVDVVTVGGLHDDEEADMTVDVYGPFAPGTVLPDVDPDDPPAMVCDADTLYESFSSKIVGSKEHTTAPFVVSEVGVYTFVATVETVDGRSVSGECGEAPESFRAVDVQTEANSQLVSQGTLVTDILTVSGLAQDETAQATVTLYGPFPASISPVLTFEDWRAGVRDADAWVCDDTNKVGEVSFEVTGDGVHVSDMIEVPSPGVYTFTESLAYLTPDGTTGVSTHPCGMTAETMRSVNLSTKVSASQITTGDSVFDTAIVEGLADDGKATIEASLFGPFESVDAIVCSNDMLVDSQSFEITGNGEHPSPPVQVDKPGVFTFVETLTLADTGSVTHECGLESETFTVSSPVPNIQTQSLPKTGSSPYNVVVIGVLLLLAGVSLLAAGNTYRKVHQS